MADHSRAPLDEPQHAPSRDHWWPLADRPVLVLCIALVVGVWLGGESVLPLWAWLAAGVVGGLAGMLILLRRESVALLALGVAACGGALGTIDARPLPMLPGISQGDHEGRLLGFVVARVPSKTANTKLRVEAHSWVDSAGAVHCGRADVFVSSDVDIAVPDGLPVECVGTTRAPSAVRNPGEFSYVEWLAREDVSATMWAGEINVISDVPPTLSARARRWAALARSSLRTRLHDALPPSNANHYTNVLASLVLGIAVAPVAESTVESFRLTGTLHLLVVSGAQVSFLAGLVLLMLGGGRRGGGGSLWAAVKMVWQSDVARAYGGGQRVLHVSREVWREHVAPWGPRREIRGLIERRPRWWHMIPVVAVVAFFAVMVGMGPSVSRAAVVMVLLLASMIWRLDYDAYTAIGMAGAAICLVDPGAVHDTGAQLSFAATIGVVAAVRCVPQHARMPLGPWLQDRCPGAYTDGGRMVGWLRYVLWVVVAVAGSWVMVTPILAHVFGTVALTGAIANLSVVPVCGVVLLLTCAAIPFLYIAPVIASVPLYIARALVDVTFGITEVCKSLPFASISGVHFPAAAVVVWYGALLGIACYVRARARGLEWTPTTRLFAALSAALAAAVWFAWVSLTPRDLRVTFLDVGHGQCCVIEAPSGRTILVDAGRAGRSTQGQRLADDVILPFLASRRVRNVDAIVITHPDADHCNAIERVIREIPCGVVLESFPDPDSTVYARLADAAVELGVPVRRISAGGQISLGSELRTQVLWPPANVPSELYDDNDRSAVLMLTHGRIRMLLTGDIENEAEHAIQRRGWPLAATVLQVPHHGGASSLGRTFLRQVRPDAAVVSCAEADAHHPHPVTIDRLRQASVRTWRTDLDGAVTLISDGETVRVRSQVARSRAQTEVLTGAGPRAALPGLAAP